MLNLFYRNSQLLILTLVLILVWGLTSFLSLPRMEDPELTARFATITTLLPGASAERVESLITEKLEDELAELDEIDVIESTSRLGISVVGVELKESVRAVDTAWSKVRDQMSDTIPQLPAEATDPEFELSKARANALILGLTWDFNSPPNYAILRRQAETLQDQLRQIPGTETIDLFGEPEEEIIVEIQPEKLAQLGLTPQQLAQQIQFSDAKVTAGQLRSPENNLLFEIEGELKTLERIRTIPIQVTETSLTLLGDIAQIQKGIKTPLDELALIKGKPAIVLAATIESNERIDLWANSAHESLHQFTEQLPQGLNVEIILDQSHYVEARLNTVISNLIIGASLVVSVTLIIMGWKSALIVGSALPLATLMVFGGMTLLQVPLHQMSVTGIMIALGLLIDNAIIAVDEIQIRLREGLTPAQAVTDSTQHLVIPLLSSTLTTVLAFLPIALAPGGVGEFTGSIGITVILALTSSLFLSLTVIPALVGRLTPSGGAVIAQSWWQTGLNSPRLAQWYQWTLTKAYSKPLLGVALSLVLPLTGFAVAPLLPQQFFPPSGRDQFQIELELPNSTAIDQTQHLVLAARDQILAHPEVEAIHWFLGNGAPRFYYNVFAGSEQSPYFAQALVQLNTTRSQTLIQMLQLELDQAFPQAQILVRQLEQGPPFEAPIELRLYGPDLTTLRKLGHDVRGILAEIPDVTHTRSTLTEAQPKLELSLDEDQSRLVGLDKTQIARQLDANLQGSIGGSILETTEELPVRVRVPATDRGSLETIESLDLVGGRGQTIPLTALGSIQLVPDTATIARREGQRVNTVQAFITAGVLPSQVLAIFQPRLEEFRTQMPPGYSFEFGGETDARSTAIFNLLSTVGVLGILMVATLVLSFNSFAYAGLIGLVALASLGLGQGALFLSGYPFGFMAILGSLGLLGLAINDSIVVLAALREDPQAQLGNPQRVTEIVFRGTRHIVATTLTTLVGFIPLLFDPTGFWPPLAICIAGGLGGTTLLALYGVPSVYLLLTRRRWQQVHSSPIHSTVASWSLPEKVNP